MIPGVVREWHSDEGWGVIDSDQTPGGCWAHFSDVEMDGYRRTALRRRADSVAVSLCCGVP